MEIDLCIPCPSEDLPPIFEAVLILIPARDSTLPNSAECSHCLTGTEILETKFMLNNHTLLLTVLYKRLNQHLFTDKFLMLFMYYRQKNYNENIIHIQQNVTSLEVKGKVDHEYVMKAYESRV
jgi:hypothetical protein